jgi:hypothetical protein
MTRELAGTNQALQGKIFFCFSQLTGCGRRISSFLLHLFYYIYKCGDGKIDETQKKAVINYPPGDPNGPLNFFFKI